MGSGARRDVTQRDEPSGGDSRGTGPRGGDAAPGGDVSAGELVVGVAEDEVGGPQQRQRVRRGELHGPHAAGGVEPFEPDDGAGAGVGVGEDDPVDGERPVREDAEDAVARPGVGQPGRDEGAVGGGEDDGGVGAEARRALVEPRAERVGLLDLAGVRGAGGGVEDAVEVAPQADVGEEGQGEVEAAVVHAGAEGVAHLRVVDAVVQTCKIEYDAGTREKK